MSTRCQIKFVDSPVYLYQHSDGYPSYMLNTLLPFLVEFHKSRGHQADYMVAQLMARMIFRRDMEMAAFRAEHPWASTSGPDFLGYGIDTELHGDTEFLYEVTTTGSVVVKMAKWNRTYTKKTFATVATFELETTYKAAMAHLALLAEGNPKRFSSLAA